jgi:alcohol dehydrogenase class IV
MSNDLPIVEMSFPTRMVVGPGALHRLPQEMWRLDVRRALIVTDVGVSNTGLLDRVQTVLSAAGLESTPYLGVSKNPKEQDVLDGVETYRKVEADVVIGLGGGAPMDVAKAIRLKTTHELPLADYDDSLNGWEKIHPRQPPMIAIPTTAGTGSEVGRSSVIVLGADQHKVIIFSPFMMPNVALCDPALTVGLPPHVTAATGMDALTHCLEAYVCKGTHPFADVFALSGLARIGAYLLPAVRDGRNLKARNEMMLAASSGAVAFQKGLGACHALAHPLSSVADLHHGLANALMLPYVIRYNLEDEATRKKYAIAAKALGADVDGVDAQAEACLQMIVSLRDASGLPKRLSECGVTEEMIDRMVPQALTDPSAPSNPVPLTKEAAYEMYRSAF